MVIDKTVIVLLVGVCVKDVFCVIGGETNKNSIARGFDSKGMLSSLAGSLMSRGYPGFTSTGGSQVVSLNLTNLVVLVLLKALIFAAGSLGAGAWKGGLARNIDGEETLLTDQEILLFISYLTGSPGSNGCLQKIACEQPQQAKKYVAAGDMLLKTAKTLALNPEEKYDIVLEEVQEAADWGYSLNDCNRFKCGSSINNDNLNN